MKDTKKRSRKQHGDLWEEKVHAALNEMLLASERDALAAGLDEDAEQYRRTLLALEPKYHDRPKTSVGPDLVEYAFLAIFVGLVVVLSLQAVHYPTTNIGTQVSAGS